MRPADGSLGAQVTPMVLRLSGRMPSDDWDALVPPVVDLAGVIAVEHGDDRWRVQLHGDEREAAAWVRAWGLRPVDGRPGVYCDQSSDLTLAVGDGDVSDTEAEHPPAFTEPAWMSDSGMAVEWMFRTDAARHLPAAPVRVGAVDVIVDCAAGCIAFRHPGDLDAVQQLLNLGFTVRPVSAVEEDIEFSGAPAGRLIKTEPSGTSGFDVLDGLARSAAHPHLTQPFPHALEQCNLLEVRRVLDETMDPDADTLQLAAEHSFELCGIDQRGLDMLTSVCLNVVSQASEDLLSGGDSEWADHAAAVFSGAVCAGARVMRSQLARAGYDTSLSITLPGSDMRLVALTLIERRRALQDVCGLRGSRVWSLPLSAAVIAEAALYDHLQAIAVQESLTAPPDTVFGGMLFCFDAGAHYHLARCAPQLGR